MLSSFTVETFETAPLIGNVLSGGEGAVESLNLPHFTLYANLPAIEILDQPTLQAHNTTPAGNRFLNFDSWAFPSGTDGELEFEFTQPVFAFGFDYTGVTPGARTFHVRVSGQGFYLLNQPTTSPTGLVDGFWGIISSTPFPFAEIDDAEDGFFGIDQVTFAVPDSDGDGVPDSQDVCLDTPAGAVVDAQGCSLDQLVPCAGPRTGGTWRNHGEYVSAIAETAEAFLAAGLSTEDQADAIVRTAAQSDCGKNATRFK